ncbi:hypothetical protein [Planctomycetes bacterium K23_9]|uniref:Uncharacterized protein n=1 Tax=Stieleria marina TaxID=1930275 RepID=A0A517NVL3_9BACT|nr:hypothetical protein K239x_31520 [Planctomycetes bacterium K23_9]
MIQPTQIVPGICVDESGQATVDPSMHDVLFDLALNLEEPTDLAVDMQHVVAALVLARRDEQVDESARIKANDQQLIKLLVPHIKSVFSLYNGQLGADE